MAVRRRVVLLAVLFLAVLPLSPSTDAQGRRTVRIGSWNIMNLGAKSVVGNRALVISQFDIVALQEIQNTKGLARLEAQLATTTPGVVWDSVVSRRIGKKGRAEYYAFLYRTDRVQAVEGTSGVYSGGGFSRPPFYATFQAGDFDFTLITVHTRPEVAPAEVRRLEKVWNYVQAADESENDLLLMGDFNVDGPERAPFDRLRDQLHLDYLIVGDDTKTSYSTKAANRMANWYDNIWADPEYTRHEYTHNTGVDVFYDRFFVSYSGQPRLDKVRQISDHCPVWAVFWTNKGDDD